jgi:hypothetical protein
MADRLHMPRDQPPAERRLIACRDHVRVPGGRVGEVIGFYRNDEDLVLVRLGCDERRRYARGDLRLVIG